MNLSLSAENTSNRRFVLLAPSGRAPRGAFRHVEANSKWRQDLLADMQRLRGRIYQSDGAINPSDLTADGRHVQPFDEDSWHLLVVGNNGRVLGCTRYLQHHPSTPFNHLRVRTAAIARSEQWGAPLRRAVEKELAVARDNGFSFVEVGGWALDESLRGSTDALRSVLFTYAWSYALGGCLGLSTATHRNGSAAILRRIGGRPLECDGTELPPYYDPHYKCEMEVLRFDSRMPSVKYSRVIDEMRMEMHHVPVVCGSKPAEAWHSLVQRLRTPAAGPWVTEAVAPAA